ncbi:MFS transporter [Candidatus Saccharibacteria bacterium TM7i]|nr:MFS transporter [Candidatus Saccharibacteria bacterium TM7i]
MKHFKQVLFNTLIANVTTSYLWFAVTFWAYLETKSVLATSIVGGLFMLLIAATSIYFGALVDHHKKKSIMVASTIFTLVAFSLGTLVYFLLNEHITSLTSPAFWLFAGIILAGAVVENMRNIALGTTVTLLVPEKGRDKANGMVGAVQGVAFMVTSVFSGLSIGLLGMGWTLAIALILTALSLLHLITMVRIPEPEIYHDPALKKNAIDLKGSIATIRSIPGLVWLIIFTTFNNLVGGVFMALMDPYGLTLFPVEIWGVVLGITSIGFIAGGIVVSKVGLGKNPLRTMLIVNLAIALLGIAFVIREWWPLYVVGMFIFMCLMPIAEATEQTILQKVVPFKRQGRVFGLAQTVESAASPISAFMIGPIAQFALIPYMASDAGKAALGWLVGSGEARGIALVFIIASLIMIAVVLYAFTTKAYRNLSTYYLKKDTSDQTKNTAI